MRLQVRPPQGDVCPGQGGRVGVTPASRRPQHSLLPNRQSNYYLSGGMGTCWFSLITAQFNTCYPS